jgi:heme/copper-type cytochrome/quinol oxidase subunit 2
MNTFNLFIWLVIIIICSAVAIYTFIVLSNIRSKSHNKSHGALITTTFASTIAVLLIFFSWSLFSIVSSFNLKDFNLPSSTPTKESPIVNLNGKTNNY